MHQCQEQEQLHELQAHKLVEEAKEYLHSRDPRELADLMELMDELLKYHGISIDQLRTMQMEKREERGGYENRIVLDWIREE
jgi:predicted house-cleaning noncanonical NTP pyrophosphatase (MazG superfamily)